MEEEIKEAPFFISTVMEANFKWNETISGEELDYLLNSNAPAILLSYIRPYISNITVG